LKEIKKDVGIKKKKNIDEEKKKKQEREFANEKLCEEVKMIKDKL
jgi:hypothetical protein